MCKCVVSKSAWCVCVLHSEVHAGNSCSLFTSPGSERLRPAHQAAGEVQKGADRSNKSECVCAESSAP